MELYELEDIHEKITFHCTDIENNLDYLGSLIESLDLENYLLEEVRQSIRTVYLDVEQKYAQLKEEISKEESKGE